jgi:hypothetical protein
MQGSPPLVRRWIARANAIEAILDGRQSEELRLEDLLEPLPLEWAAQRAALGRQGA